MIIYNYVIYQPGQRYYFSPNPPPEELVREKGLKVYRMMTVTPEITAVDAVVPSYPLYPIEDDAVAIDQAEKEGTTVDLRMVYNRLARASSYLKETEHLLGPLLRAAPANAVDKEAKEDTLAALTAIQKGIHLWAEQMMEEVDAIIKKAKELTRRDDPKP